MFTTLPCDSLLVGVCGSVHATHLPEYLRRFKREFATDIRIMTTAAAQKMVSPEVLQLFTDEPVLGPDCWGTPQYTAPHIQYARWAQLFVVLPATADILGKAAGGIADDLLSTTILASDQPVVFAPSMNPTMWESPSVVRNVAQLRSDGHYVITPSKGTSLTTGNFDVGLGPTLPTVLAHLFHVRMRRLRAEYLAEATRHLPASPAEKKKLLPVVTVTNGAAHRPEPGAQPQPTANRPPETRA